MPWLVRDEEKPEDDLLFVHVPRCGGTSLTKHFQVAKKCRKGLGPWRKFGITYWFYRYALLEKANFPWMTIENVIAVCEYTIAVILFLTVPAYRPNNNCDPETTFCGAGFAAYSLFATGTLMFLVSTFVATAPFIGRHTTFRRIYAMFVTYIFCNWMGREKWLVGCNIKGWFVHFTAAKMLKYGSIEEKDLENSFAIVRNPYSRMVSVYMYNRYGELESFKSFVKRWCKSTLARYQHTGSTEEWDTYCHALPMFEFTHLDGEQIVKCIIKQEELKTLWYPGLTLRSRRHKKRLEEIPPKVAAALRGMPHANSRKRSKPWWDYYDQELVDLVAVTYAEDFYYFGYDISLPNRPDLNPPPLDPPASIRPFSSNLDFSIYKDQDLKQLARRPSSLISTSSSMRSASRRFEETRKSSMMRIDEPSDDNMARSAPEIRVDVPAGDSMKSSVGPQDTPSASASAATFTDRDIEALEPSENEVEDEATTTVNIQ